MKFKTKNLRENQMITSVLDIVGVEYTNEKVSDEEFITKIDGYKYEFGKLRNLNFMLNYVLLVGRK